MATRRRSEGPDSPRRPLATSPEARERQMINLAYDLVEKRFRDGDASAQETTLFLKLGSSREFLEQERLRHENELTEVKIAAIQSAEKMEELYAEALGAMRAYKGETPPEDDELDD